MFAVFLLVAGVTQVAYANTVPSVRQDASVVASPFAQHEINKAGISMLASLGGLPPIECPEGTYRTGAGHCQPDFDFD
jgi:hypothetical protein